MIFWWFELLVWYPFTSIILKMRFKFEVPWHFIGVLSHMQTIALHNNIRWKINPSTLKILCGILARILYGQWLCVSYNYSVISALIQIFKTVRILCSCFYHMELPEIHMELWQQSGQNGLSPNFRKLNWVYYVVNHHFVFILGYSQIYEHKHKWT
jgi:hypothetical protein